MGVVSLPVRSGSEPRRAVISQVQQLLDSPAITPEYHQAVAVALAVPGNILSTAPNARWAQLVWTCCAAAGGRWEQAVPAAAAVEVLMVALDILDDEEDEEENALRSRLGAARTLNVSTGLLLLAQRGLLTAGGDAAAVLLDAGLRACSGQHADLSNEPSRPLCLQGALRVTAGKSASLVAAICRLGTMCASAHESLQELYGRFGWYLGMAEQLANDLAAIHPSATGKSDIELNRPTLPLAFARLQSAASIGGGDEHVRAVLASGEPGCLTWAAAETYRRQALGLIDQLSNDPMSRTELAALLLVLG